MQMAGELAEMSELGGEVEEGCQNEDDVDAKPDRRGRFLLFKRWFAHLSVDVTQEKACIFIRKPHSFDPVLISNDLNSKHAYWLLLLFLISMALLRFL